MFGLIVIAVITAILAVIFAIQNAITVAVSFLHWEFESSLALILLVTFALGILTGFFGLTPTYLRNKKEIFLLRRQLKKSAGDEEAAPQKATQDISQESSAGGQ